MILPLLSQSSQKARVAICKQVTSILILTSQEPWTTTSHIWSSDMNWIVREGIVWRDYGEGLLFSSKLLKTNSLSLSSSSLSNSSSFPLHLLIPRHFLLCHHTIRLCSQTLWCVGNNDISGRSQVLLLFNFSILPLSRVLHLKSLYVRSASFLSRSSTYREDHTQQPFRQATSWNIFRKLKNE